MMYRMFTDRRRPDLVLADRRRGRARRRRPGARTSSSPIAAAAELAGVDQGDDFELGGWTREAGLPLRATLAMRSQIAGQVKLTLLDLRIRFDRGLFVELLGKNKGGVSRDAD